MAENEKQNPSEEETNKPEGVDEKINKEETKEENLPETKEENNAAEKEQVDKKEENNTKDKEIYDKKEDKDNKNEEIKKEDNEEEDEDDQKKLIKSINELPTESIKAKSIVLYDLNEDMKSQYLDEYKKEKVAIELKELDAFLNYLNKIREVINSTSNEKENILSLIEQENKEKYSIKETEEDKSEFIPINKFWSISLINAKFFEFSEKDKKIIEHLIDIKYTPLTYPSFKVEFIFEDNEYLEENIIYKTYHFQENEKDMIEKSEGCEIKWKSEDKNPTIKTIVKQKKKKKEYFTKNVKSFFNIFDTKNKDKNLDKELVEAQFFRNDFLENMLEYYLDIMEFKFNEENDDEVLKKYNPENHLKELNKLLFYNYK